MTGGVPTDGGDEARSSGAGIPPPSGPPPRAVLPLPLLHIKVAVAPAPLQCCPALWRCRRSVRGGSLGHNARGRARGAKGIPRAGAGKGTGLERLTLRWGPGPPPSPTEPPPPPIMPLRPKFWTSSCAPSSPPRAPLTHPRCRSTGCACGGGGRGGQCTTPVHGLCSSSSRACKFHPEKWQCPHRAVLGMGKRAWGGWGGCGGHPWDGGH